MAKQFEEPEEIEYSISLAEQVVFDSLGVESKLVSFFSRIFDFVPRNFAAPFSIKNQVPNTLYLVDIHLRHLVHAKVAALDPEIKTFAVQANRIRKEILASLQNCDVSLAEEEFQKRWRTFIEKNQ